VAKRSKKGEAESILNKASDIISHNESTKRKAKNEVRKEIQFIQILRSPEKESNTITWRNHICNCPEKEKPENNK
jgi:hypothetical protein